MNKREGRAAHRTALRELEGMEHGGEEPEAG